MAAKRRKERASAEEGSFSRQKAPPTFATSPQSTETAAYIAEMCSDLTAMAKDVDLKFLAHLLSMAQAAADCGTD